jgi:hypothetical protein
LGFHGNGEYVAKKHLSSRLTFFRASQKIESCQLSGAHMLPAASPHRLARRSTGTGMGDSITPACSCGWVGSPEYGYSSFQHVSVAAQERIHLSTTTASAALIDAAVFAAGVACAGGLEA